MFPQELLKYKDPEILKMRLNGKNIQVSEGIQTTQGVAQKSLDDVIKIILPELLDNYSYSLKAPLNKILCKKDYSEKIADEIASDILFISDRYGIEFYPTPLTNKMIDVYKRQALTFSITCFACSATVVPTISPVAGLSPI